MPAQEPIPGVPEPTSGLMVVAIPLEQYDTIMETLSMDEESSAFDQDLRKEIRAARCSVTEIAHELDRFLESAERLVVSRGVRDDFSDALQGLLERLALALVLEPEAEDEEEDEEDE